MLAELHEQLSNDTLASDLTMFLQSLPVIANSSQSLPGSLDVISILHFSCLGLLDSWLLHTALLYSSTGHGQHALMRLVAANEP